MGCCYSASRSNNSDDPKLSRWKPLEKRSCTDVIPLTIFVLFFAGMVIIAAFSIANGAASRLINGYDSYGNICNQNNKNISDHVNSGLDLRGKKYVFFMDPRDLKTSLEICVTHCPTKNLHNMEEIYSFYQETGSQLCNYNIKPESYLSNRVNSKAGPCPVITVNASTPIVSRCIPSNVPEFLETLFQMIKNLDTVSMIIKDLYLCRYAIFGLCFLAVLLSFIIVLLIRYLASAVVYIINIVVVLASLVGTGLLWWMYVAATSDLDLKPFNFTLPVQESNADAFLWYSIAATAVTVILLLLILVMRKRVALAVDLFYEAGRCIMQVPMLLLQPLWTFLVLLLFWLGWVTVFAFFATAGKPYIEDPHTGFVRFNHTTLLRYMWWYHLVGLIWISEFILACQQMIIAGTVAQYYFTRDKKELKSPIITSMSRLIANHLGSCALGSFIIVLVKIPRCILMYIHRQIADSENICAKLLVKCCIICLCILEKCLRYLNYNAYSLVAINGTHFCKSACDAVATLLSNPLRVVAINTVGLFVLVLGKLLVVASVAGICGLLVLRYHPNVQFLAVPVGTVAVFAYLIAHCFLSVYEMVIDTLLLCFCEDSRVNNGKPGKEYFMSKSLMVYVKKSSKTLDRLDGKKKKKGDDLEEMENLNPGA